MPFDWVRMIRDSASVMDPQTAALIDLFRQNMAESEDRDIRANALQTVADKGYIPDEVKDTRGALGGFLQDIGLLGDPGMRPLNSTERQGRQLGQQVYQGQQEAEHAREFDNRLKKAAIMADTGKVFGPKGSQAMAGYLGDSDLLSMMGDPKLSDIPYRGEELALEREKIDAMMKRAQGEAMSFSDMLSLRRFTDDEARRAADMQTSEHKAVRKELTKKLAELTVGMTSMEDEVPGMLGSTLSGTKPNPKKAGVREEARRIKMEIAKLDNGISDIYRQVYEQYGIHPPAQGSRSSLPPGGRVRVPLGEGQTYDLGPLPPNLLRPVEGGGTVEGAMRQMGPPKPEYVIRGGKRYRIERRGTTTNLPGGRSSNAARSPSYVQE